MANVLRKERRRRKAIRAGVRRYWRSVSILSEEMQVNVNRVRKRVREIKEERGVETDEAILILREEGFPALWEGEEYAFGLMETVPDLPEQFTGKEEILADFRFDIFFDKQRLEAPVQQFRSETFPGSDDRDKWWTNYFGALKTAYDVEFATAKQRWPHLTSDDVVAIVTRIDP